MARNDVYLNINALSPADAVVTGQQDMTAATVPELVLGDTPTFNFLFTDNTNVWPSWAGNAAYTVTWALSDAVSGDFSPAATTGNATPITGGWSIVLPLNAYDLVGLLNTKRVSQPYPVTNLWQQIRVADPSGNEITRAMFWTPVRYRAISDTQNTESASPTGGREVTVDNVNVLTTPTAAQFYAANPVPTSALGSAANGELLIGNGTGFTKSTLTAGTGITVTNGSGSITIDASGAQETLTATVKNAESVAITKGQVVYLFGATGNMPSVKLAYNTSDATSAKTFGVVSDTSIAPNGTGTVTCVGVVDGLNLGAYQDGDTVYLGATPGSITATKPYAPNHLVYVGIIERANAGNGELYVRVQNGYELDEIHDVQINSPRQSGQTLIYDNTTSLWKNARITAGSNIAVTNGDGSISIGFSGTLPVANGGTGVTTSTGSGSVVLSTSPTLTTPILGTPQSGTLSSCTGLPISTGVSGLGTNVATFLATPSSANLASAVTDETGTGALVFANTPTLVTPNIGAATGISVNLSGAGTFGGNLTVSGTATATNFIPSSGAAASGSIGGSSVYGLEIWGKTGSFSDLIIYNGAGNTLLTNLTGTQNISLAGNLTVSGTGTSSVAGNFGIGTTSPEGRLHLAASASGATGSILVLDNPIASALNNSNQIAFLNDVGASYAGIANVRLKSLTTNAGNGSSAFTITTFDGSSEAERVRVFANGNFGIGTGSTDGGQKLQVSGTANIGNPFSTSTDDSLILHGKAVSDGSGNYGDYGSIVLSSSSSFTASARRYLITNAYLATDFAIIRSTNATTTPTIGTNGVVSSGTVDFRISESGNATFAGGIIGMTQGNVDNISDDGVASFTPLYNRGFIVINNPDYSQNALIAYFKAGSSYLLYSITKSADVTLNNSTTLTGTTGTDGKLNIGYNNSIIYIENRLGGIGNFQRYALGGTNN